LGALLVRLDGITTQRAARDVATELNDRPRETLGWLSSSQALDEALR
jgi:IS30 family transposase